MEVTVAYRKFHIWKLELWWVFTDAFPPKGRKKIKGNWYWRTNKPQ